MTSSSFVCAGQRSIANIKRGKSVVDARLLYLLFLPLPLVDSLNGMINGGGNEGFLSLGMLYRICIIAYCCFVILKGVIPKRALTVFVATIALFGLPHAFDLIDASFLSLAIKTMLPVLCIEAFIKECSEGKLGRRDLEQLIDVWSVLFPLAVLLPLVLGLGFQTYGAEDVGYKGFFYAQNDLCFVLSILFFFCCGRVFRNASFLNAVKLLLTGICIVLLGMKSGYLLACLSVAYWVMRSEITLMKRVGIVVAIGFAALAAAPFVSDAVGSILNRWMYFSNSSDSFLDFFSSGRLERIPVAVDFLSSTESNPAWFIFGVGMRYGESLAPFGLVEMDPIDLFFQFGALGTAFLLAYYLRFLSVKPSEDGRQYRFALLMAFALSISAGHVLNSALSAMAFAVMCSLAWVSQFEQSERYEEAEHAE